MKGFYLAIGKQGSGKTLFITKLAIDNKDDRKIFSNYSLFGVNHQKITLGNKEEVEQGIGYIRYLDENKNYFNNSIMLLDEIHIYLDSLDFMRENNRRLHTFFSQLRKRNILLLGTTQYLMNVDVRIRRQCMNVFEMKNLSSGVFNVITHEIDGYYSQPISDYNLDLSDYYYYYDTNEIIM